MSYMHVVAIIVPPGNGQAVARYSRYPAGMTETDAWEHIKAQMQEPQQPSYIKEGRLVALVRDETHEHPLVNIGGIRQDPSAHM